MAADCDALYAVASDPLLWAQHPSPDRWQERAFRELFDGAMASGGALAAIDREDGRVIGSSRYRLPPNTPDRVEIGWTFLARSHWGGAHNREMKHLMLTHAFRFVKVVIFRVGEANLRSQKALAKIGARLNGETEVVEMSPGRSVTHVIFEIRRAEFAGLA